MKKRLFALLLACTFAVTAAGCGTNTSEETSQGSQSAESTASAGAETSATAETLTIAITKDENTLSPFTYVSGTGKIVNRLMYDTLFTKDLNNELIPWMVEDDYEVVDSQEFTFTLKEGMKFHNGNPVTPEDVKFSFEYPAAQNASAYRNLSNQIESIEILDERTIKFTLKEPNVNYMQDGFAEMRILDDAVYEGVEDGSTITDSIGSGMYALTEYKSGEYYKFEAVEDYFRGTPKVKYINMPIISDSAAVQQGLMAGELAAATSSIGMEMVESFEAMDGLEVFASAGYAPEIINFNDGILPFSQKEFRTALTYAIDVNGICKTLYGDYATPGTKGAVRSDLPYAIEGTEYEYNPDEAQRLLDELGYTQTNSDGIRLDDFGNPISLEMITYADNANRTRICELVKEQLKAVGIDVEIKPLDMDTADAYIWPDFEVSKGRDYQMSTWGWSTSISMTYLVNLCASDFVLGNYNVCGYQSEAFDSLIDEKLDQVRSVEEMEALLRELQQVVAEENPLITVAFPDQLQVCNTKMYDGWKAGKGTNVINIFSFLDL